MKRYIVWSIAGVLLISGVTVFAQNAPECHQYNSSSNIFTGFGMPYNLFSPLNPKPILIKAYCSATSLLLEVEDSSDTAQTLLIYKQGYTYQNGRWVTHNYTGAQTTGVWIVNSASATVNVTAQQMAGGVYVLAYTCALVDSAWKCGCRDTTCTTRMWQLQLAQTSVVSSPSPSPTNSTVPSTISAVEQALLQMHNEERANRGLSTLVWDNNLATIARGHSQDMITRNFFSHVTPDGCNPACRLQRGNYLWGAYGENIFSSTGHSLSNFASLAMQGWMNSSGHRANILSNNFTHVGVGVVMVGNKIYATTMFSKPR
jgi:uncharacterized protein YkwD